MMIKFNVPAVTGKEIIYIEDVINSGKFAGNHKYTGLCDAYIAELYKTDCAFTVPSCTHALELSAILLEIKPGDEVILPSFGFTSTANAFVLRGAKIVFVDIRPDTMNIDENLILPAITERTKVVVIIHYAGISCEMDKIVEIVEQNNLALIEDNAQAIHSRYKGALCGTFGDISTLSFHETKNIQCGEGGAIVVNNELYKGRSRIIRDKGTNRINFNRGEVQKYSWVDIGSSYLPSELASAFLYAQLQNSVCMIKKRLKSYELYRKKLTDIANEGFIQLPGIPDYCQHNAHIFYLKTKDKKVRDSLISFLKSKGIMAVFHYVPLHSSMAGMKFGRFCGKDRFTTIESERLLRLPLYHNMKDEDISLVSEGICEFFKNQKNCLCR